MRHIPLLVSGLHIAWPANFRVLLAMILLTGGTKPLSESCHEYCGLSLSNLYGEWNLCGVKHLSDKVTLGFA